MASRPINQLVLESLNLAQIAGWKTVVKNDLVKISPPGLDEHGRTYPVLTINIDPNEQNILEWAQTARKFGLVGSGPAMTPVERAAAEAKKAVALETERTVTREQAQKKQAERDAAAKKAAAATAAGRTDNPPHPAPPAVRFQAPAAPVRPVPKPIQEKSVTNTAAPAGDGRPKFEEWMLTAPFSKLEITSGPDAGRFMCPECLRDGDWFAASAAGGLAPHRGFKHALYNKTSSEVSAMVSAVLPESVRTALDLLQSEVADHILRLQEGPDAVAKDQKIVELTKRVGELEANLVRVGKDYTAANTLAGERAAALAEVQAKLDSAALTAATEQEGMLKSFEVLLREIKTMTNTLSPVQAVAAIDKKVDGYLS